MPETPRRAAAGAGRVIAGTARGIRLVAADDAVRPMGDRLKEALFAMLEPRLRNATVLDLFAGTGAGGIEALSRGAASATFVERHPPALKAIDRNLAASHLAGSRARVVVGDAIEWLIAKAEASPYDVILLDPPYDRPDLLVGAIRRVAERGPNRWLATNGILVAKHPSRSAPEPRFGLLASARERRFGESALSFYEWATGDDGVGEREGVVQVA
jgi:16S rRNA (guanine966-N2)-methyltransferase